MSFKFKKRRKFPFIKQTSMMECGTTSLSMIFKYYGLYNIKTLLAQLGNVSTQGTSIYDLSEIATQFGFESDGYKMDGFKHFSEVTLPCIAHYDGNHFVVIYKINKTHIWIADPAYGKDKFTLSEFQSKWNGIIMTVEPTANVFQNQDMMDMVDAYRQKRKDLKSFFYTSMLHPFKTVIIEIFAATFLLQLLGLALPFFAQGIIDNVLVHNDLKLLYAILIGMLVILLSQVLLIYIRNLLLVKLKVKLELDFFSKFFNHLIHLTQSYFDMHKREDFIQRFQENIKLRRILAPSVLQAFMDLIFVSLYILVLFLYNIHLAGVSLFFIVFFVIMVIKYTPILIQKENKIFFENMKTMGSFMDTLLGIGNIKLLGIERYMFWKWKNKYKKALNKVLDAEKTYIKLGTILRGFYYLSHIIVYWMGAYMALNDEISIGQYVAFISIFTIVMNSLTNASSLWFMMAEISVTYTRLNDVLIQVPEPRNLLNVQRDIDNITLELKNVSFSYEANPNKKILDDLNLKIEKGNHIGIVGRNGSGKTTLVKLLAGLYSNYEGEILVNNISIQNFYLPEIRKKIHLFPQNLFLFDGTVKENIQYGNLDANMEQIIGAAKLAEIHDFIKGNYLGYNSRIGENGANLSGGEKLKIGFARLFLSNPDVIILDEASSALDVVTEKRIMNNLYQYFSGKTIITIAHRVGTLKEADDIYVIDKGAILEKGSHIELLAKKGLYYQFIQTYVEI